MAVVAVIQIQVTKRNFGKTTTIIKTHLFVIGWVWLGFVVIKLLNLKIGVKTMMTMNLLPVALKWSWPIWKWTVRLSWAMVPRINRLASNG